MRARRVMRRRAIARTAAVGGAQQEPVPEDAPAVDPIEQLKQLNELREQGILTEEEFAAEKAKLLG